MGGKQVKPSAELRSAMSGGRKLSSRLVGRTSLHGVVLLASGIRFDRGDVKNVDDLLSLAWSLLDSVGRTPPETPPAPDHGGVDAPGTQTANSTLFDQAISSRALHRF